MDLLNQLMNPNKQVNFIRYPTGQVNGAVEPEVPEIIPEEPEKVYDKDYARPYQEREAVLYAEGLREQSFAAGSRMTDIHSELVSTACRSEVQLMHIEQLNEVYNKFDFQCRKRHQLTIDSYKEHILNMISINEIVIIQGPTGCGKSTQVPQFILDNCRAKNEPCNIVVTQPRRIAAISVARRVCEERGWGLGSVCGYQVGLEKRVSMDTILTYVTTGVLLQKLIHQKNLHSYTHIIIDEVHERNQDMDFLLLVIRKFLFLNSISIKVILMSATFETDEFATYFRNFSRKEIIPAPVICITKPNLYNTVVYYLDQLRNFTRDSEFPMDFDINQPEISWKTYKLFTMLVRALDKLDEDKTMKGSVLVFLPGILEIEEAYSQLKKSENEVIYFDRNRLGANPAVPRVTWRILPLHSSLPTEEQRKVLEPVEDGYRKIILSTNIAESSLTISDIVYVIDFCLTKVMVVDPHTKYQSLRLEWASHVNCIQRAGRAGRLSDGKIYRLVPNDFYEDVMPKSITPEILRAPLERIVLAAKMLNLNEPPVAILGLAINPPDLKNIESTIWFLKECGALTVKMRGRTIAGDGDLTFLGRVMAQLPIDVCLSKFIVLGHLFSCLKDCIIIAAGSSLERIFSTPFQERMAAYKNKLMWSDGSCSDLIAILNLYKVWDKNKRYNSFRVGTGEEGWLKKNYVNGRAMREWQLLIKELTDRLDKLKIKESIGANKVVLNTLELPLVLKVVMCGAFYPNYFIRAANAGQVDEREAVKVLGGKDPFKTVYLSNMELDQPGPLYAGLIKDLFQDFSQNMKVSFDKSQKVYIQFMDTSDPKTVTIDGGYQLVTSMPGKIMPEVYHAVRRRQLNLKNEVAILPKNKAWAKAKELGINTGRLKSMQPIKHESEEASILPGIDIEYISIMISEYIDAGHFWAHNMTSETELTLETITHSLNTAALQPATSKIKINELYAARFADDGNYYRCRVTSIRPGNPPVAQVLFVDYGNAQMVSVKELHVLPEDVARKPAQAMECVLSEVRPSLVVNPRALWSKDANELFVNLTKDQQLYGKVYSVVDNTVHLELFKRLDTGAMNKVSMNELLINKGYGEKAEESYLSKENHMKRQSVHNSECEAWRYREDEEAEVEEYNVESNAIRRESIYSVNLKGPFSPLEMNIYGLTNSSHAKKVKVDVSDVNTVLLDTDPQDPHARLIVAESIGQTANGSGINLRHTTIMPNIHGFLALVSLVFCPRMEPKPTADGAKIAAILCGLGPCDDTNNALYAPHDMVIHLDTELTNVELGLINHIRYYMNLTLNSLDQAQIDYNAESRIEGYQRELKFKLFELLKYKRKDIEPLPFKYGSIWNKAEYNYQILSPDNSSDNDNDIFPPHWTIKLNTARENQTKLRKNLELLSDMAMKMIPTTKINCEVCGVALEFLNDIRLHISSSAHREKLQKLGLA